MTYPRYRVKISFDDDVYEKTFTPQVRPRFLSFWTYIDSQPRNSSKRTTEIGDILWARTSRSDNGGYTTELAAKVVIMFFSRNPGKKLSSKKNKKYIEVVPMKPDQRLTNVENYKQTLNF